MGRRDCGIGNRKAVSSKLDADLVAEPPYYAAFPAHRLVAGEEQNELIRNRDALGIEPRAALRDIGDETVARQRAGRLDLGHTIDGVALVPAPFLQHEIFDRWMRDIRPNLASKWFKNPYYGLRTGGSLAASTLSAPIVARLDGSEAGSMRFPTLVFAIAWAGFAHAATISVQSASPEKPAVVAVQGTLEAADGERFFAKVAPLPSAVVRFESNGGSVVTGIQIGEIIRLREVHTIVPAGARCASACALAWLGGSKRFMGPGARIGLHAASDRRSGQTASVANALMGAYLTRVGLPYSAVIYLARTAPNSVTWLSF